jgi:2-aminoethylphosphonate-pyruvate transaminase
MTTKESILFTAGPVNIEKSVKRALMYSDMGHREPEFDKIVFNCRTKLTKVYDVEKDYDAVIFNASGTGALEALISSIIPKDKSLLVVSNGYFGERLAKIAELHNVKLHLVKFDWEQKIDYAKVEKELIKNKDIYMIFCTHIETSTGELNNINKMFELSKKYDKLISIDCMSSFGGELIDLKNKKFDFIVGNSNKSIESCPVLSFIMVRKDHIHLVKASQAKTFYLNFKSHYEYIVEKNQTPYTPMIPLFTSLDKALDNLLKETVIKRNKRYQKNAKLLRQELVKLGLKITLDEDQRATILSNAILPENISYQEVHDYLKSKGFVIYPIKDGPDKEKKVHFGNIGQITKKQILEMAHELKKLIKKTS